MTDPAPLDLTVHIAADPATVFRWFTDPARYVQWMGRDAILDAQPGGTYQVGIRDGVTALGQFEEVDPPHRLVFTWGWVDDPIVPPGSTRVEVTLEADADGTLVRLRHHGLPSPEARDRHREGWKLYLPRLAAVVPGGEPGPDPNAG